MPLVDVLIVQNRAHAAIQVNCIGFNIQIRYPHQYKPALDYQKITKDEEQRTKKGQVSFSASWASSQGLAIHRSDYPLQRREARAGRDRSSLPSLKSCDSKAMNHRETTSRHSFPKQCQK